MQATKCDDISCSEVIRALRLEDDSELEKIEDEIDNCNSETEEWKERKAEAEANAKGLFSDIAMPSMSQYSSVATNQVLKQLRPQLAEYEDHLKALQSGEPFVPKLTAKKSKSVSSEDDSDDSVSDSEEASHGKKRKYKGNKGGSNKRRKSGGGDDDEDFMDEDEDILFSDSGSEPDRSSTAGSASDDSDEESDDGDTMQEDVTEESLQAKIQEARDNIKQGRIDLSEYRRLRKEASDALAALKKRQTKAQREKNAFCSLKRSEVNDAAIRLSNGKLIQFHP